MWVFSKFMTTLKLRYAFAYIYVIHFHSLNKQVFNIIPRLHNTQHHTSSTQCTTSYLVYTIHNIIPRLHNTHHTSFTQYTSYLVYTIQTSCSRTKTKFQMIEMCRADPQEIVIWMSKNCQNLLFFPKQLPFAIFWKNTFFPKKCQVFGNFLTVKWQFFEGSGVEWTPE